MRALSLSLPLMLVGCGGSLAHIEVDFSDTTTVPGGSVLSELLGGLGFNDFASMDLTEASELENQGVQPGDIEDVRLITLELEAIDPPGADLSFLSSMDVDVEAPSIASALVASQDQFPAGQSKVEFNLEDLDLTEYVVSESMTLTTDVSGNLPPEDTTVEAYVVLDVGVTLQGVRNSRDRD